MEWLVLGYMGSQPLRGVQENHFEVGRMDFNMLQKDFQIDLGLKGIPASLSPCLTAFSTLESWLILCWGLGEGCSVEGLGSSAALT